MIAKVEDKSAKPPPEDFETKTSRGERAFNIITYGLIEGLMVFAAGIPLTYSLKYGKGAEVFKKTSASLQHLGMSASAAEDFMMSFILMQPGNAFVVPVRYLEANKPAIVAKLNHWMGDETGSKSVEGEPKQTWKSLAKSRVLMAFTPVFVTFRAANLIFGPEKFAQFENWFARNIVCKPFGYPLEMEAIENGKKVMQESKAFRIGKIAAWDSLATAAAATLFFIGTRVFAKQERDEQEHLSVQQHNSAAAQAVLDASSQPPSLKQDSPAKEHCESCHINRLKRVSHVETVTATAPGVENARF